MRQMSDNHWSYIERTVGHSGSISRVHWALSVHPEGLTLKEIAEITGLAESTIRIHGIRNLLNFQIAREVNDKRRGIIYNLVPIDVFLLKRDKNVRDL